MRRTVIAGMLVAGSVVVTGGRPDLGVGFEIQTQGRVGRDRIGDLAHGLGEAELALRTALIADTIASDGMALPMNPSAPCRITRPIVSASSAIEMMISDDVGN